MPLWRLAVSAEWRLSDIPPPEPNRLQHRQALILRALVLKYYEILIVKDVSMACEWLPANAKV